MVLCSFTGMSRSTGPFSTRFEITRTLFVRCPNPVLPLSGSVASALITQILLTRRFFFPSTCPTLPVGERWFFLWFFGNIWTWAWNWIFSNHVVRHSFPAESDFSIVCVTESERWQVINLQPMYCLDHPNNYLFLLSKQCLLSIIIRGCNFTLKIIVRSGRDFGKMAVQNQVQEIPVRKPVR